MKKLFYIFLLIGFFSCSIFAQSKTNEEYKIYAVVLRDIYKEELKNNKQKSSLVIFQNTIKPKFFDFYIARKEKGLREDFRRKNKTAITLEKRFPLKFENYIVSKKDLDELIEISKDNAKKIRSENEKNQKLLVPSSTSEVIWKPFYEKFPKANGYYSFSRIGFSSTKRFVVLQVHGEGLYWTSESTYILMKTKKGWKIYTASRSGVIA